MNIKKQYKIGILDFTTLNRKIVKTFTNSAKEIRMLSQSIKNLGHISKIYKVEKCQLYFHNRKAEILYNNKKINGCDILIPRFIPGANLDLEISIVKQFQMMGIPILNEYLPISRAKNKLRTLQILTRIGIPVPRTIVVRKLEYMDEAIKNVGGYPVILKTPFGSLGAGVVILESRRSLFSALDIIWNGINSSIILIQEYLAEADGSDYRAFVLGDKVIASMKRTAKVGEFRSNLHLGGNASPIILTQDEQKLAVKAAKSLGLHISGVDILRSKDGPVIMEVNANPGFMGITETTGINVAGEIVKYALQFIENSRS